MKSELINRYQNVEPYQKGRDITQRVWWEQLGTRDLNELSYFMGVPVYRLLGTVFEIPGTDRKLKEFSVHWMNNQEGIEDKQKRMDQIRQQTGDMDYLSAARYDLKSTVFRSFLAGVTPVAFRQLLDIDKKNLKQANIVDVCSGNGEFIANTLPYTSTGRRFAIDLSMGMLKTGERTGNFTKADTLPVQANALELPIATGWSDLTIMNFGIDTVSNPKHTLSELSRITKPGGKLVLSTPLPLRVTSGGKRMVEQQNQIGNAKNPIEDLLALNKALTEKGFKLQKLSVTSYYNLDVDGIQRWNAFILVSQKVK